MGNSVADFHLRTEPNARNLPRALEVSVTKGNQTCATAVGLIFVGLMVVRFLFSVDNPNLDAINRFKEIIIVLINVLVPNISAIIGLGLIFVVGLISSMTD